MLYACKNGSRGWCRYLGMFIGGRDMWHGGHADPGGRWVLGGGIWGAAGSTGRGRVQLTPAMFSLPAMPTATYEPTWKPPCTLRHRWCESTTWHVSRTHLRHGPQLPLSSPFPRDQPAKMHSQAATHQTLGFSSFGNHSLHMCGHANHPRALGSQQAGGGVGREHSPGCHI